MELQRIGMKVFCREGASIPLVDFIPVFHRWIQTAVTDTMLIDVADYSHVFEGPGILLVAHEGNFAVDETHGRRGLVYYQKTDQDGDLDTRLSSICKRTLRACRQLQSEPEFADGIRFDAGDIEIFSNDRLFGPNTPESRNSLEPHVMGLLSRMYGNASSTVEHETDTRERLSFCAKNDSDGVTVDAVLERLGA